MRCVVRGAKRAAPRLLNVTKFSICFVTFVYLFLFLSCLYVWYQMLFVNLCRSSLFFSLLLLLFFETSAAITRAFVTGRPDLALCSNAAAVRTSFNTTCTPGKTTTKCWCRCRCVVYVSRWSSYINRHHRQSSNRWFATFPQETNLCARYRP